MRVAFYTLGCKLNQAETESLSQQFSQAGFELVAAHDTADIYIAHTCTVTHIADRKSRHWLRLARRRNPKALIIATGCYARRAPQELAELADFIFDKDGRGEDLLEMVKALSLASSDSVEEGSSETSLMHQARRCRSPGGTTRVRSLIKIQDGCHSPCTYCIVPRVRPHDYSVPASRIVKEVKDKVARGYKEAILTGTKIGSYKDGDHDLRALVEQILTHTSILRLRLSSLQPQEISSELLSLWQDPGFSPRLCRHFHLALQSGSDTVLQRMRRGYSLEDYGTAMNLIREMIPGAAITTDIMVGFPGESDEEFEQSRQFCQQAGFANIHVFPFSPRPGTQAAKMPNQVKDKVKKERSQKMLELAQSCKHSFYERFLGQTMGVLWEAETRAGSSVYSGFTDNYIRVFARREKPLTNEIAPVRIVGFHPQGMWGEVDP